MTKSIPTLLVVLLAGVVLSGADKDRHVVVISLDGFPAYMWHKPDLPIPNLRKLAAEGASADAMLVTNPSSTWSNHTTMVTGVSPRRHGVLYNGLLVRGGPGKPPFVEQWADKTAMVRVPTLYDIAHEAGLTTAESDWVAILNSKSVDWSFSEIPRVDGPVEREMMKAGLLTEEQIGWMQHRPGRKELIWHDEMWTKAAVFMFTQHHPNLLLYHTLNTDAIHHNYGPGTAPSYTALAYADRLAGDLIQAVEASGLRDKTTFIVVTDHGFKKISRFICPNVALKKAGYIKSAGPTVLQADAYVMPIGGTAYAYVTDPARRAELLPKLRKLFESMEGVERVIGENEYASLGLPDPATHVGSPDLVLVAKDEGLGFNDSVVGDDVIRPSVGYGGTHGFLASDPDLDGIFIASGAGIKKGVILPRVKNLDVAPTMARLLGLKLPEQEGRVLEEILETK